MNTLDRLAAQRPTDAEIDAVWSPDLRAALLEDLLNAAPSELPAVRFRPRRRVLLGVGVVAAVLAVVIPVTLPHSSTVGASPAAAAELDRLAKVAATAPYDRIEPGQFLRLVEVSHQEGNIDWDHPGTIQVYDTTSTTWISSDGALWRRSATRFGGQQPHRRASDVTYFKPGAADLNYPNPSYLQSLPTTVTALESYLRRHVSGSTSRDEAVFVAIGDMLRGGFAPQALRVAAIGVLKRTPHVELGPATTDAAGRPVAEFVFIDQHARPGTQQSYRFSTRTGEIVEEVSTTHASDGDNSYRSTITSAGVVTGVPCRILDTAEDGNASQAESAQPAPVPAEVRATCAE